MRGSRRRLRNLRVVSSVSKTISRSSPTATPSRAACGAPAGEMLAAVRSGTWRKNLTNSGRVIGMRSGIKALRSVLRQITRDLGRLKGHNQLARWRRVKAATSNSSVANTQSQAGQSPKRVYGVESERKAYGASSSARVNEIGRAHV